MKVVCLFMVALFLFHVLSTSKVISGWVSTCKGTQSWQRYSPAPLGNQATSTMTWYPTQWHWTDTEPTSHFPILIMPSNRLESDEYQFQSHWFDLTRVWTHNLLLDRSLKTGGWRSAHSDTLTGHWTWFLVLWATFLKSEAVFHHTLNNWTRWTKW